MLEGKNKPAVAQAQTFIVESAAVSFVRESRFPFLKNGQLNIGTRLNINHIQLWRNSRIQSWYLVGASLNGRKFVQVLYVYLWTRPWVQTNPPSGGRLMAYCWLPHGTGERCFVSTLISTQEITSPENKEIFFFFQHIASHVLLKARSCTV